jgi:hypothetical protein
LEFLNIPKHSNVELSLFDLQGKQCFREVFSIVKVVIASSILVVWVFRFDNIVKEFKQYELSDLMRTIVGASKIILATLLVVSIWHEEYVVLSAAAMGFLMIVAQYFHFKVKNPWQKHIPSLFLLTLCIYLIYQNA